MSIFRGKFEIIFGQNKIEEVSDWLSMRHLTRIGLIVDKNLLNSTGFVKWKTYFESNHKVIYVKVPDLQSEPSYQDLDREFEAIKLHQIDVMIAFGGGSVLDIAKGLCIKYTNAGPSVNYRGFDKVDRAGIPLILFPSTAGTGTEMTWTASFIDLDSKIKLGINGKNMFPSLSVLDPKLLVNAPFDVICSAALDVLVHAIEAVTSKNSSYFAKTLGISATKKILHHLPLLMNSSPDLLDIETVQIAAAEAGLAMLNSSGGPASGISYPMGVHFKVPHGFAGGIVLPLVIKYNIDNAYEGYGQFFEFPQTSNYKLFEELEQLYSKISVPVNFVRWGFSNLDHVELIYTRTIQEKQKNLDLNPIHFSHSSLRNLLETLIL